MKRKSALKLTPEERRMEAEFERGEWKPIPKREFERLRKDMVVAAGRYLKVARVNLRMNGQDLAIIREKAEREGIPYQTLISSILHKYATDQLVDESVLRRVNGRLASRPGTRKRA